MSESVPPPPPSIEWLQQGQALEARGQFAEAVAVYNHAISTLRAAPSSEPENRRLHGLAWMNRANALQQQNTPETMKESVAAYDEAIALFDSLPLDENPQVRNHIGAAWMNRGHAMMLSSETAGILSFENAIAHFEKLPLNTDPYYILNLAGAWTNLAHATLATAPDRAHQAAQSALQVLREVDRAHEAFATMSLRARRAGVMGLGEILRRFPDGPSEENRVLVSEATDLVDDGLKLARDWEAHGATQMRPLAARLFHMGTQLYARYQPQFLGEFVLENVSPGGFGNDAEFVAAGRGAIEQALAEVRRPGVFVAGTPQAQRQLEISASLREAQQQLAALPSPTISA